MSANNGEEEVDYSDDQDEPQGLHLLNAAVETRHFKAKQLTHARAQRVAPQCLPTRCRSCAKMTSMVTCTPKAVLAMASCQSEQQRWQPSSLDPPVYSHVALLTCFGVHAAPGAG